MNSSETLSRFILGTAQLGMQYGIQNKTGQPSEHEGADLLRHAYSCGVLQIDTADVYGTADKTIRRASQEDSKVEIHTKFVFQEEDLDLERALSGTLERLGVRQIASYSFHRFDDFRRARKRWGDAGTSIRNLKNSGRVKKIGVSVYSNAEALEALECPWVDQLQMPLNLLDHAGARASVFQAIRRSGKILHVRSVFLQGLLHAEKKELAASFQLLFPDLDRLRQIADARGLAVPELALLYPFSLPEVSGVVVGLETRAQLESNLATLSERELLDERTLDEIHSIQVKAPELLSPANWR